MQGRIGKLWLSYLVDDMGMAHQRFYLFIYLKKVHLGINRKMPKGYNEFIQYITTLISTSTSMSSIKSPHVMLFQDRGGKSHLGGAYLHFILSPKEMKSSTLCKHKMIKMIYLTCYCHTCIST